MQRQQFAYGFLVEFFGIWRLMEVQVTTEHLIGPFARQHHLDAHRFNLARHQIHRRGGADGGDVISFDVVDHVADGVQAFLHREVDFMVDGAKVVSDLLSCAQIRGAFQPDGEGVQLRPPGFTAFIIFYPACGIFFGDGEIAEESSPPESSTP